MRCGLAIGVGGLAFAALGACVGDDPASSASVPTNEAGVTDDGGAPPQRVLDGGNDAQPPPPCYPTPSGQIAWWTADGTYADKKGTYTLSPVDLGSGGTVDFVSGRVGQAFDLKDAFLLKQSVSGTFTIGYSVEGWMNARSNLGSIAGANKTGVPTILIAFLDETTINFRLGSTNLPAPAPPANQWVHVAGTWEGTTGTKTHLYLDGVEVGTSQTQGGVVDFDALKLGGAGPFGGLLDEWAMYGRALLKSEVEAIVAAGPSGRCKS
jgi:hypothetical protein